jgi:hypothetical protein
MRQKSLKKQLENISHERLPVCDSMAMLVYFVFSNLYLLDTTKDTKKD